MESEAPGIGYSDDRVDHGYLRCYIQVSSQRVSLADIIAALGITPDESHDIGDDDADRPGAKYSWSSWTWDLEVSDDISMGTEGLSEAIEKLSDDLADRLKTLSNTGCNVGVMVIQEFHINATHFDTGIHLEPRAVNWIARAGAFLDIDQYMWVDDERESVAYTTGNPVARNGVTKSHPIPITDIMTFCVG